MKGFPEQLDLPNVDPARATSLIALLVAMISIWATLRAGRAAREERLWVRRADTYVELLSWAIRQREAAKNDPRDVAQNLMSVPEFSMDERVELEARVSTYASTQVDQLVDEISRPWNHLRLAWGDWEDERNPDSDTDALKRLWATGLGTPEERVRKYSAEVATWCDRLVSQVRSETVSLRRASGDRRRSVGQ